MTTDNPAQEELLAQLAPHGQQHLLAFWDQLSEPERRHLADQIRRVDFELIDKLYRGETAAEDWAAVALRAAAPPAVRLDGSGSPFTRKQARARGEEALSAGKLGVVLVAGGQGTRLGFDHPKGMYPIGPLSQASLFQILLHKIVARARRHGRPIPLYLMTSPATHDETVAFLAEQQNFGLPREEVHIFCQGTMPAVDAQTGQMLLADKDQLFLSPDGHGGMLAALSNTGGLRDMRRRGIEHLFYLQVDNPLVSICDPEFVGYHLLSDAELTAQVVAKQTPRDKVGNVALVDGQLRIIEYSDLNPLPDEIVDRRSPDGTPVFWAGSIAVHAFSVAFLERMASSASALPFHIAKKAVPYLDPSGQHVTPSQPNAIKFERFIFDLLPSAERALVIEVEEADAFAPLKNAPGEKKDTPEAVQAQMIAQHRRWLRQSGCRVEDDVAVEISPLFAQDAEETATKVAPGTVVTRPHYFC